MLDTGVCMLRIKLSTVLGIIMRDRGKLENRRRERRGSDITSYQARRVNVAKEYNLGGSDMPWHRGSEQEDIKQLRNERSPGDE